LTRSLADFAKLVDTFDKYSVSFVSVTQSFNTTSSMGRLTLNVLLSFAQFEREVIGERVRDKIAASKRKGIWVGGTAPIGYRSVNKKLVVNPDEAKTVQTIFKRYLAVGSIGLLIEDLYLKGIRPKANVKRSKPTKRFMVGPLAHILKNRFYIGQIVYRGETHVGEHDAIVETKIFEDVQHMLAQRSVKRTRLRSQSPSILTGRLFDDRGNRMSPSHSNKKGVRYRYYVSQAVLQNRNEAKGIVQRVSAPDIEGLVVAALRQHIMTLNPETEANTFGSIPDGHVVAQLVQKVTLLQKQIRIEIGRIGHEHQDYDDTKIDYNLERDLHPRIIVLSWALPCFRAAKGIAYSPSSKDLISPHARDELLKAIARSRIWARELIDGHVTSFSQLAQRENLHERHIRLLTPLAFLSPKMIKAIADGRVSRDLTVSTLARALPPIWSHQETQFGVN
jgi:site-specific DNA recombinase